LGPDVTLIVGPGVTLFASRDPALYAAFHGSCEVVSDDPGAHGCKPLISVDRARDSTVQGTPAEGNPASCAGKFVLFPQ
jgi:hypothetical protein